MHIALDAMGGDHGPEDLIAGALLAIEQADITVSLVGEEPLLKKYLSALNLKADILSRVNVIHASQQVEMHENPVEAIRKKRDSSILVAFGLARKGTVDAVVSAGNSGATLAAGVRKLGRLKGISRPGIASILPTLKKPVVMMDVGANVDCRASHLFQFGIMASSFARIYSGDNPRVGLLSIGEEAGKGNILVKETSVLLQEGHLNFIGNVEGRDVFQGDVDVVVCDGFVGNVCLKISEGLAEASMKMLRDEILKSIITKIGYLLARPAFKRFRKRLSYDEYGGAPLLGINGVGIICHGKSNKNAIMNAIMLAQEMVTNQVNQRIVDDLAAAEKTGGGEN